MKELLESLILRCGKEYKKAPKSLKIYVGQILSGRIRIKQKGAKE